MESCQVSIFLLYVYAYMTAIYFLALTIEASKFCYTIFLCTILKQSSCWSIDLQVPGPSHAGDYSNVTIQRKTP